MDRAKVDNDFTEKVRFHLSKDELERQMRYIHDRGDPSDAKDRPTGSGSHARSQSTNSLNDLPRQESWTMESVGGYYLPNEDVGKMPLSRQEQLLIRDLIYAFSGVPSSHVKPDIEVDKIANMTALDIAKVRFRVDEAFHGSFRVLANDTLPLVGYYISVQSFIEETNMSPNCGRTRLALATAFSDQMQEYYDLQSKLETDQLEKKLNLKDLVRQVKPWLGVLKIFSTMACSSRGKLNSAQLLTLLDQFPRDQNITEPDLKERVSKILAFVTRAYMKIVQLWTQKGVLYDAQHEFFVEDSEPSNAMSCTLLAPEKCCHTYWSQRYILHPNRLPAFLLSQVDEIFLAGKYLNILRQCNVTMKLLQLPLSYTPGETGHVEIIKNSYDLPAKKLLEVLMKEHSLALHLRNLRLYFLMQLEGFSESLLDKCQEQLQCISDKLIPEKLQPLLTETLKDNNDFFKDKLRIQIKNCDAATQLGRMHKFGSTEQEDRDKEKTSEEDLPDLNLYGYEAIALRYEAKWPLSFVLYPELLEQMQILQRVLFYLRYVTRHLTVLWQNPSEGTGLKITKRSGDLRQRMLMSMINLEHHITLDIAEPRWQSLSLTVDKAENIDEVVNKLENTVDECLRLGLLSATNTFVGSLFTLGQVCLNFCGFVESKSGDNTSPEFEQGISEYEEEFDSFMCTILELLSEMAKTSGSGERDACKKLVQRLKEFCKFTAVHPDSLTN
ncbi:gamma-tubulin complex component 2 homolog [Drosophila ficusphila]|uniref:gamma-tubulin complex component 2 homolog n=1 Tax=Drosophila ficusphila TaxID=30025 RepID=UPI0007E849DB|nr:gamma-tubulin complex component 2 homolog [Drosophila ficusphila]